MTLSKLSFRNAKRQASDYLIYFVTIIMVCAMLYAFNRLALSDEIAMLSGMMSNMTLIIVLASAAAVFIIGGLVSYTTGFMLSRRSRELGTYLLIGLENKQVARLFFLENLSVGIVALLIGIPLGNLLFQALRAILLTMFSAPYHFRYDFSLKAIGLTLACFSAIYLFALIRSRRRIRNMKLYDLIYFERKNETAIVKTGKTRRIMFSLSLAPGIIGTVLLMTATKMAPGVLGAFCIIVFLYCFFTSFSSGVPAYFDQKPKRKYQGQNLIIFRTLTSKLATTGIVMATVSLLFTGTLLTEGTGMVFHGIFEGRLERDSFDLLFASDQAEHKENCKESMIHQLPITGYWEYRLYSDEDESIISYLENTVGYLRYNYDHRLNGNTMIAYSDYAALREMLGLPAAEMERGTYLIHCLPYLKDALTRWKQPLSFDGENPLPGTIYTEQFSQNLWNGNGHQFLIVVPDKLCAGLRPIRYMLAAMTEYNITPEQVEALQLCLARQTADGVHSRSSGGDLLYSKATNLSDTAMWSAMSIFPLFYLALTLAMTAATVLTVQQLSEAGRYRRQFELLRKLGMDREEMKKALFRQFAIYYAMPVIPPVLIAVPFVLDMCRAVEPGTMAGASSPTVILAVALGLFFLIYLVYIVIAYSSMKRNVLPNE